MRSPRVLRAASLSVPRVGGARHGRGTAHLAAAGAPSSDLAQSARLSARAGRQQRLDGRAEVGDRVRVPACGLRDVGEGDAVRGDEEEAQWPRGKGALEGVGHPVDVNGEGPRQLVHEELGGRAPLRQGGQWRGGGGEGKVVGKEGTGGRASGGGPLAWASVACWLIAHTPGGGQGGNAHFGAVCGELLRPRQARKLRLRRFELCRSGPSLQMVQGGRWGAVLRQAREGKLQPAHTPSEWASPTGHSSCAWASAMYTWLGLYE